jgi:hypothetical protein
MANSKLQFELGADHLTFTCTNKLGGGGIKIPRPALTNWGEKYPAPVFGGEKSVAKQHGCRDRFDQSQKISWFDFQGLV